MHDVAPNLMDTLSALPLFAGLAPDHLRELARVSHTACWQKGGAIFRAGDMPQSLFVVLSGHVKRAMSSSDGSEKVIDVVAPGQMLGETDLLGERPYATYAVAAAPTVLLCIGGDGLHRVIGADSQLALRVLVALARRQYDMECDSAARHFRTGYQRVLDYFLHLAGNTFSSTGETLLSLPISKQLIAGRIGITPESLSRALRDFSDDGLIVVDGRHIRLQNARIVRQLAASPGGFPVAPNVARDRRRTDAPGAVVLQWPALPTAQRVLPMCSAINIAGRQRMLSQRMAAYWLLQAGDKLDESMREFDSRMAELVILSLEAEASAALETLRDAWLPYKALLGCAPGRSGVALIFEQSEKVLAAAQRLTQALADNAGTDAGLLIGLAGRQRMLSQRMAKFFLFRQWGMDPARCREELEKSGQEFGSALGELIETPLGTPRIHSELVRVSRQWQMFQALLVELEGDGGKDAASRIVFASERVLENCDVAVSLYERLAA